MTITPYSTSTFKTEKDVKNFIKETRKTLTTLNITTIAVLSQINTLQVAGHSLEARVEQLTKKGASKELPGIQNFSLLAQEKTAAIFQKMNPVPSQINNLRIQVDSLDASLEQQKDNISISAELPLYFKKHLTEMLRIVNEARAEMNLLEPQVGPLTKRVEEIERLASTQQLFSQIPEAMAVILPPNPEEISNSTHLQSLHEKAKNLNLKGCFIEAKQTILEAFSYPIEDTTLKAHFYLQKTISCYYLKQFSEASLDVSEGLKFAKETELRAQLYLAKGKILKDKNKAQEAALAANEGLMCQPNDPVLNAQLCLLLSAGFILQQNYAIKPILLGLGWMHTDVNVKTALYASLALCYNHQGKYDKAEKAARKGLEFKKLDDLEIKASLYYMLALALKNQKKSMEALSEAQKGLALLSQNSRDRLGLLRLVTELQSFF